MKSPIDISTVDFDPDKIRMYDLHVLLGEKESSMVIHDPRANAFLRFRYAPLQAPEAFESWIKDAFQQPFRETRVLISDSPHVLFPSSLFDRQRIAQAYSFHHEYQDSEDMLMFDTIKQPSSQLIFKIPNAIHKVMQQSLGRFSWLHQVSALLAGLQKDLGDAPVLALFPQGNQVQLFFFVQGQLVFENAFVHEAHEDILYFTLAVLDQFEQNPKQIELRLFGEIQRMEALKELLMKYILEVRMGQRPSYFDYDATMDAIPSHLFYPLFSSPLCEF